MFKKLSGKKVKSKSAKEAEEEEALVGESPKKLTKKKSKKKKDSSDEYQGEDESFHDLESLPNQDESMRSSVVGDDEDSLFSPKSKTKKKSKDTKKTNPTKDPLSTKKKKKKVVKEVASDQNTETEGSLLEQARKMEVSESDDVSARSGRSARSRTKTPRSKKKKKTSSGSMDDDSIASSSSKRSAKKTSLKRRDEIPIEAAESIDQTLSAYSVSSDDNVNVLAENEALQAETVSLRQRLAELNAELDEVRSEKVLSVGSGESIQVEMELKRAQNEVSELKMEVEEYEEAVVEKDGLIKKLTEAVDSQLDKVEYLELKLQRAEEEFCKMEDEMKDMEDEIETLRLDSAADHDILEGEDDFEEDAVMTHSSTHSGLSKASIKEYADEAKRELAEDERHLDIRESEIEEREDFLLQKEQELLNREKEMKAREQEFAERGAAEYGDEMDQIRMKELRVQEYERDVRELEEKLTLQIAALEDRERGLDEREHTLHDREYTLETQENASVEKKSDLQDEISLGESIHDSPGVIEKDSRQDEVIELLKENVEQLTRSNEELQRRLSKQTKGKDSSTTDNVKELKSQVKTYEAELNELREISRAAEAVWAKRDNQTQLELQQIREGTNKQLKELDDETRQLRDENSKLKGEYDALKVSILDRSFSLTDHAVTELQEEIASLRETILQKELEQEKVREQVAILSGENEEQRAEIGDLEKEIGGMTSQLRESKDASTKKMEQKDETISFMQNEMLRLTKEKQAMDQKLRETATNDSKTAMLKKQIEMEIQRDLDAEEMAKIHAFNQQLVALDNENQAVKAKERKLQEELNKARFEHELKLKEKDARILQIEEELADLNWEMNARKEADYVSLLKDRKDQKKQLESTKNKLKKAEEHSADLQRKLDQAMRSQEDVERDIDKLNSGQTSTNSGDYSSGLRRQIRSLKDHNMALERKLENEASTAREALSKKDDKIAELEQELTKAKNPAQAAVQGMFRFGKRMKGGDQSVDDAGANDAIPRRSLGAKQQSERRRPRMTGGAPSSPGAESASGRQTMKSSSLWNVLVSPFGPPSRKLSTDPVRRGKKPDIGGRPRSGNELENQQIRDEGGTKDLKTLDLEEDQNNTNAEGEAGKSETRKEDDSDVSVGKELEIDEKEFSHPWLKDKMDNKKGGEVKNDAASNENEDNVCDDGEQEDPESDALNVVGNSSGNSFRAPSEDEESQDEAEAQEDVRAEDDSDSTYVEDSNGNESGDDSLETADDIDTDDDIDLIPDDDSEDLGEHLDKDVDDIDSQHPMKESDDVQGHIEDQ